MRSQRNFLLGVILVACGGKPGEDSATGTPSATSEPEATSGSMSTGPTTGVSTMTMVTASSTSASEGTTVEGTTAALSTGGGSTTGSTGGDPPLGPCDGSMMPDQDCPEGHKCTIDGSISQTHCVEVVPAPKGLDEPCQVLMGDAFSGFDDCGVGMVCWNVDPDTGVGRCTGYCQYALEEVCADPTASCQTCQECAFGLCIPGCDPLGQDCEDNEVCIPNNSGDGFICVNDGGGDEGQAFDPCEFVNVCDPGLVCLDSDFAVECDPMATGCCLPFCDTTAPQCPGAGQECTPWFEEGVAPPGLEDVGVCALP